MESDNEPDLRKALEDALSSVTRLQKENAVLKESYAILERTAKGYAIMAEILGVAVLFPLNQSESNIQEILATALGAHGMHPRLAPPLLDSLIPLRKRVVQAFAEAHAAWGTTPNCDCAGCMSRDQAAREAADIDSMPESSLPQLPLYFIAREDTAEESLPENLEQEIQNNTALLQELLGVRTPIAGDPLDQFMRLMEIAGINVVVL